MMERPQFSIVIPHRDDLIGLVRTLAALERLSKASPSFEVIVADNRSRSGLSATREVAAQFQSLKARVVVPDGARGIFGRIVADVERSLFAGGSLTRTDWDRARGDYAGFALGRARG